MTAKKLMALLRIRSKRIMASKNDPLGSYTGTPKDPRDKPEQDADDL